MIPGVGISKFQRLEIPLKESSQLHSWDHSSNEDGLFNLPPYARGRLAIDWAKQKGGKTKLAACQQETTLAADDWTRLVWMTETSPFHNKKKSIEVAGTFVSWFRLSFGI